jgi:hypothetical protein
MNRLAKTFLASLLVLTMFTSCQQDEEGADDEIVLTIDFAGITATSVDLSWTPTRVVNFLQYEIHYSQTQNFTPTDATLYETVEDRDETTNFVTDLEPNTTYHFRIRVRKRDGNFFDSNEATTTTTSAPPEVLLRFVETMRSSTPVSVRIGTSTIGPLNFEDASPFAYYNAGQTQIVVSTSGTTIDSSVVFISPSIKASIFILDKPTPSSPRLSLLTERYTFEPPVSLREALIRFVNASNGLDSAKLHVGRAGGMTIGSTVKFGKAGVYSPWQPGTLTLFLTRATDTLSLMSATPVTFAAAKRYTIAAVDTISQVRLKVIIDD